MSSRYKRHIFVIRWKLVIDGQPKDTMHKVDAAVEQIYPGSASGKGDAFYGNKNRE
jgi:hypothetical protein